MRLNRTYFFGILILVTAILEVHGIKLRVRCKFLRITNETEAFDYRVAQDEGIKNDEALIITRAKKREIPEKHIVVVIPSYNNKKLYEKNLLSVIEQEYNNYHVIYVDDCSSDGTASYVEAFIQKYNLQDKFLLLKNQIRCRPSRNIYHAIHTYCADNDIVVILDGDDWFAQKYALAIINQAYEDPNVWLTYGDHRMTNGQGGRPKAICQEIIDKNEYRKIPWCITHPRSYYAWLYKIIKLEDLQYQGAFIPMAQDFAKMLPMLEMTGGRFKYIKDILYIYYTHSGAHHFRIDPGLQSWLSDMVKSKKPYEPLKKPVIKSTRFYAPFSCSLILVTKLDKKKCRKKLENFMANMTDISKYYMCSTPEEVALHLESVNREDYCLIATNDIFNHKIDLSSAVALLRQTEALVVSFGKYIDKREQEVRNTTYFKDGIFTFQLGWKPCLIYAHKEFAHIFPRQKLENYLAHITHWCDDELCLKTTQDKRFIEQAGLMCITH